MTRQITATIAEIRAEGEDAATRRHRLVVKILRLPLVWLKRQQDRWALQELTPMQLRDMGLDPLDVRQESVKGFWRE